MNIKQIVSQIAKNERLKVEVSVGNIREIVSILSDMIYTSAEVGYSLYENGLRRSKRKKKR